MSRRTERGFWMDAWHPTRNLQSPMREAIVLGHPFFIQPGIRTSRHPKTFLSAAPPLFTP
eukprot:745739-Karenia_brevis.AAC.1